MRQHIIATMRKGDGEYGFCVLTTDEIDDVFPALESATEEFLSTNEGREYHEHIAGDAFNIGDATIALPKMILVKHGIFTIYNLADANESFYLIEHDRPLNQM